tara:strand:+ start:398 stop:679 length:282 start_codon:yes stop_codon:yes gene_type:complete
LLKEKTSITIKAKKILLDFSPQVLANRAKIIHKSALRGEYWIKVEPNFISIRQYLKKIIENIPSDNIYLDEIKDLSSLNKPKRYKNKTIFKNI